MLKVDNVSAGYAKARILEKVSMEANPGEVVVIVGPNGSGKSTLLKTIAGLTTIYEGTITFEDKVVSRRPPHQIARAGVAYLPQTEGVFTNLTVAENFRMAAYTVSRADYGGRVEESLSAFPRLSGYLHSKVSNLSGGERQMVAMSMAMIRKPKVVMFDEPTANLAPKIADDVLATIRSLAEERGLAVVLVEQNARKALDMGDRAYLLVSGRNAFTGGAKELLSQTELARLYLGMKVNP